MNYNHKTTIHNRNQAGMTILEMVIAISVFAIIMMAVAAFQANVFSYKNSISGSLQNVQDAQIIMKTMLREMREISPGVNGSYALVKTGTSTLIFFADANNDGSSEQITYSLSGNQMKRATIHSSGSPASYNPANQSTTTMITNVRNSISTPVFEYFDNNYSGTSSPLTQPVTATSVRLIKINLTLDVDPNKSPTPITYSIQVSPRNLKTNL